MRIKNKKGGTKNFKLIVKKGIIKTYRACKSVHILQRHTPPLIRIKKGEAMQKSDLITRKEVSSILKVSESTVIRWVKAKHFIPPFVLGPNRTVWSKTAVMAWLEKQKDNIVDWVE